VDPKAPTEQSTESHLWPKRVGLIGGGVSRFGYEADCLYQTVSSVEKSAKLPLLYTG